MLVLRAKVDKQYRKEFTKADFQADYTGDLKRDPFVSFLVTPTTPPAAPTGGNGGNAGNTKDECEGRTVATKYAYTDLSLIGIIMQGTKSFAMFKDPQSVGHIAYQGECLSKDKARLIEITPSCVIMELRGEAPPGAAAPPPHQEPKCTHPDDIEITSPTR
jgi:hypothetical protein